MHPACITLCVKIGSPQRWISRFSFWCSQKGEAPKKTGLRPEPIDFWFPGEATRREAIPKPNHLGSSFFWIRDRKMVVLLASRKSHKARHPAAKKDHLEARLPSLLLHVQLREAAPGRSWLFEIPLSHLFSKPWPVRLDKCQGLPV